MQQTYRLTLLGLLQALAFDALTGRIEECKDHRHAAIDGQFAAN